MDNPVAKKNNSTPIVFFPMPSGEQYAERQIDTRRLAFELIAKQWTVVTASMTDDDNDGYDLSLRMLWASWWARGRDLIIVEHDMGATIDHLVDLWWCDHDLCAYAYTLYPASTRIRGEVYAHRTGGKDERRLKWIREGDEWADYVGFGLVKISGVYRRRMLPGWETGSWRDVDTRACRYTSKYGDRWHIHWPAVAHHHK